MGALSLQEKKSSAVQQKYEGVKYHIEWDTVLSQEELNAIRNDRFSRKPIIYKGNKNLVVGVLLTKSLVGAKPGKTLEQLYLKKKCKIVLPLYTGPDKLLFEALTSFEKRACHIAFVTET